LIRTTVDRAFEPTRGVLEEAGEMVILTGRTIVSAVTPPYPYGPEFVSQFLFALRLCWLPLLISTIAFGYEAPGLQAANFLVLFGALDRLGGFFVLASIREFAPFVDAIVLAGVAGTAITADLGARRIREELDALDVLGVDVVRYLILPRVAGITFASMVVPWLTMIFGEFVLNLTIAPPRFGTGIPVIWDGMRHSVTLVDLLALELKQFIMGFFVAIVACERGLTCKRGAEGVGRAVNQCVVIGFFGIWLINSFWNTAYLSLFPNASGLRG
jgi:phospholipid/cholesterol/gamma-HCH transport system permease protein